MLSIDYIKGLCKAAQTLNIQSDAGLELSIFTSKSKAGVKEIVGFTPPTYVSNPELLDCMRRFAPLLGIEQFVVKNGGLFSDGAFVPPREGKRLVILTPVHQRFELLKLFSLYTRHYLIPALRWLDFEVLWICAGSPKEKYALEDSADLFLDLPNDLATKKNRLFEVAKSVDADFAICIDSDDFVPPSAVNLLIQKAKTNSFWSALEAFAFFSAEKKEYHHFKGYPKGHDLHGQGLGSGRVYTRKFLRTLGENPLGAEGNKGMDMRFRKTLEGLCLEPQEYLVSQNKELPVGLKTNQNIWQINQYTTEVISAKDRLVAWLPETISESIRTFSHSAD